MGKADFREWIKADFQGVELGRLKCVMIDFFFWLRSTNRDLTVQRLLSQ